MTKEIEIQGCITIPKDVSMDEVIINLLHSLRKMSGVLAVAIAPL